MLFVAGLLRQIRTGMEDLCLLGYNAMWPVESEVDVSKEHVASICLLPAARWFGLFFDSEYGSDMFLRNVG
jgi:hypothetical protein